MAEHTMSQPITRGELHEALETWTGALLSRLDERFAKIDERFAKIDERFAKIEATMATKDDLARLEDKMASKEDLARHANAMMEAAAAHIAIVDEQYKDLPGRVAALERTVHKRTRRAALSRSPGRRRR
jgi:chromosome segregation ATPase